MVHSPGAFHPQIQSCGPFHFSFLRVSDVGSRLGKGTSMKEHVFVLIDLEYLNTKKNKKGPLPFWSILQGSTIQAKENDKPNAHRLSPPTCLAQPTDEPYATYCSHHSRSSLGGDRGAPAEGRDLSVLRGAKGDRSRRKCGSALFKSQRMKLDILGFEPPTPPRW